ncbi:unnamed protein product [Bursaphelenchus xylophilus]|uniref:(pine wood nematode) hypothetical protein n=1 Tax=Bursaphelenchus xylophilus TaxID=6326 RepID=A0A1I7RM93_BURXY|nr:unnamed protein product [Bursaphelenchus xylophilus]CAG9118314.1 unnamed protein product [Bursaphelenchus xylophilus]
MLPRCWRAFRPIRRHVGQLRATSSTKPAVPEPNPEIIEGFDGFINDLVDQTTNIQQDAGKFRHLNSTTFNGFAKEFQSRPPADEHEMLSFLDKLVALTKLDKTIPYGKWLESEAVVSSLNAKLLHPEASPNVVVACLAAIVSIYTPRKPTAAEDDRLVPHLSTTVTQLFKRVQECAADNPGVLDISPLLSLALAMKHNEFEVDDAVRKELFALLPKKIDDIAAPRLLLMVFELHELVHDPILRDKIEGKVDELLPIMNTGEVVSLFVASAKTGFRNVKMHSRMAETVIAKRSLTANQCARLLTSLDLLSFYYPRFLQFIEGQIPQSLHEITRWNTFNTITMALAKIKVNNPNLWYYLAQWANRHNHKASVPELSLAISSLALVNIPPEIIKTAANRLSEVLKPKGVKNPAVWLNSVHSLAMLNQLPGRMAETLLEPTFLTDLSRNCSDELRLIRFIKVLQVASYLKYDLHQDVKIPEDLLNLIQSKSEEVITGLRHRKNVHSERLEFIKNLSLIIPPESHLLAAQIEPNTGAYVDGILYFQKSTKRFVPVKSFDAKNKDIEKVALIFATHNILTKPDLDERNKTRVIGEVAMNCRHLNRAGFRPVVVRKHDLNQFADNLEQTRFIKTLLLESTAKDETPDVSVFERQD